MSEPSQLVVKVHISEEQYWAFWQSKSVAFSERLDWEKWLLDQQYVEPKIALQEIKNECGNYKENTIGEYLDNLVSNDVSGGAINCYDQTKNEWLYVLLEFSESLYDYAKTLSIMQQIAFYKDVPENDYALIFDHIWGSSEIVAFLTIQCNQSKLSISANDIAEQRFIDMAKQVIDDKIKQIKKN